MHPRVTIFLTAAFFASAAFGQQAQADRVLHFNFTGTEQAVKEIATVINNIADIKQTSIDTKEHALVLHGTGSQMALGEWLFPLLDV